VIFIKGMFMLMRCPEIEDFDSVYAERNCGDGGRVILLWRFRGGDE
jgi:hypothetical protein